MRHSWNPLGPVIVVADDDPGMRGLLGRLLTDAGFSVRIAMDVPEAIEYLRHPAVAAAVLDMLFVNSDGRSGLDVLRYLRGQSSTEQLPVIILTGFSLNRSVVAEIETLRGELWHKPFDTSMLVQRLNEVVTHQPPVV